ncbi:hypothetical protein AVEN_144944-1 [Araneus ventricosus]|uniref:Uncharacterized protein n=1 Tax=Araneus ventricosus TaxID=182803 RepID=A0A4Y2T2X9_ARAVE|nr:hypothetical protein AVEN_144944-1 [Araneus ventricosus]
MSNLNHCAVCDLINLESLEVRTRGLWSTESRPVAQFPWEWFGNSLGSRTEVRYWGRSSIPNCGQMTCTRPRTQPPIPTPHQPEEDASCSVCQHTYTDNPR